MLAKLIPNFNLLCWEAIVAIICQNDELTRVQLSSNPWLFLVLILEASKMSKKFRVKSLFINLFELKGKYIHSRAHSKFWSKSKTRKSQGLLLSCTQVNSSLWQIIATNFSSMSKAFFRENFFSWKLTFPKSSAC